MMKFCAQTTLPYAVPTVASLNSIMIDGTGMCGGCRVLVGGKIKFVCVDGPEFDAHQVDFDNLMKRNRSFIPREREDNCNLLRMADEKAATNA
jgi:ferredoxin--NADP+ reductase